MRQGGNVYEIRPGRGVTCATSVTENAAVAWLTCAKVVCVTRAKSLSTSFSTQSNTVDNHSKHLARPYARCVRKSDARHKDSTTTAPCTNPRMRSVTLGAPRVCSFSKALRRCRIMFCTVDGLMV